MIILPHGLTTAEIRVLQEFRRLAAESLPLETIKAIKHPAGALGEAPAASLAGKGWLTGEGDTFTMTQKAREFIALDPVPMFEGAVAASSADAVNADADV